MGALAEGGGTPAPDVTTATCRVFCFRACREAPYAQQIVQALNLELNKMIAKPQIVAKFAKLGAEPLGGTSQRAADYIRDVGIKIN